MSPALPFIKLFGECVVDALKPETKTCYESIDKKVGGGERRGEEVRGFVLELLAGGSLHGDLLLWPWLPQGLPDGRQPAGRQLGWSSQPFIQR